jgi:hypothetical protein
MPTGLATMRGARRRRLRALQLLTYRASPGEDAHARVAAAQPFYTEPKMNKQIRSLRWLIAISGTLCLPSPVLAGNVVFDITYVDETEQTRPSVSSYNVDQHVVVTLHDGNKVTEQRKWQSVGQSSAIDASGALGETVTPGKFTIQWKVVGANSLIRYRVFPQHIEVMKIAVSGNTCEATISHNLKPGFTEYERFGLKWEPRFYRSLRSSGIACRVQGG